MNDKTSQKKYWEKNNEKNNTKSHTMSKDEKIRTQEK
jgi:hypothetical protein